MDEGSIERRDEGFVYVSSEGRDSDGPPQRRVRNLSLSAPAYKVRSHAYVSDAAGHRASPLAVASAVADAPSADAKISRRRGGPLGKRTAHPRLGAHS